MQGALRKACLGLCRHQPPVCGRCSGSSGRARWLCGTQPPWNCHRRADSRKASQDVAKACSLFILPGLMLLSQQVIYCTPSPGEVDLPGTRICYAKLPSAGVSAEMKPTHARTSWSDQLLKQNISILVGTEPLSTYLSNGIARGH